MPARRGQEWPPVTIVILPLFSISPLPKLINTRLGLVSDLPRRSAINHLQQVFQGHRVERVQWLENKGDASNAYFDKITFCFKMTALFVEVLPVSAEATA